jgi:hypothetical protein
MIKIFQVASKTKTISHLPLRLTLNPANFNVELSSRNNLVHGGAHLFSWNSETL